MPIIDNVLLTLFVLRLLVSSLPICPPYDYICRGTVVYNP